MITYKDLDRWKRNSIETARKLKLVEEPLLDNLGNISLRINIRKKPKDIWYGYTRYDEKIVGVYSSNPSRFLPSHLQEIFNQSGMDHELIGHLGNCLSDARDDETAACVTQKIMAEYRGKNDMGWKLAAKLIPTVQKYHKGIKLNSYK